MSGTWPSLETENFSRLQKARKTIKKSDRGTGRSQNAHCSLGFAAQGTNPQAMKARDIAIRQDIMIIVDREETALRRESVRGTMLTLGATFSKKQKDARPKTRRPAAEPKKHRGTHPEGKVVTGRSRARLIYFRAVGTALREGSTGKAKKGEAERSATKDWCVV